MPRGSVTRITTPTKGQTRWEARLSGIDTSGRRRQFRRRFPTRAKAEAWLSQTEADILSDGISVSADMTVAAYGAVWMRRMERQWAPSTVYARRSTWEHRIVPILGEVRLSDLKRRDCQRFADELDGGGYSANYVRICVTQLRSMLYAAMRDELIRTNPAARLELPRIQRIPPQLWSASEARTFLAGTDGWVHTLAAVLLSTGVRIGEALALRWSAVDLDARHLRIVATMSLSQDGEAYISEATKTESSRRTIPLPASLADTLRAHRDAQACWLADHGAANPQRLVFLGNDGERVHPSTARLYLARAMQAAGVPCIPPHSIRHSAASFLLAAGTPMKVVQELLGHSSIAMTSDIYSHLSPAMKQAATDQLSALLNGDEHDTDG